LSGAFGYFGSIWSFCQLRLKDGESKVAIIGDKVFAVSKQGNYFSSDIAQGELKIAKQVDLLYESKYNTEN
jgi:hypothetical protein